MHNIIYILIANSFASSSCGDLLNSELCTELSSNPTFCRTSQGEVACPLTCGYCFITTNPSASPTGVYDWFESAWGECNCETFTQTRTVVCLNSLNQIVDASFCTALQSIEFQPCEDPSVCGSCWPWRCLNGGTCVEDFSLDSGFFCDCPNGFTGTNCEGNCVDEWDVCESLALRGDCLTGWIPSFCCHSCTHITPNVTIASQAPTNYRERRPTLLPTARPPRTLRPSKDPSIFVSHRPTGFPLARPPTVSTAGCWDSIGSYNDDYVLKVTIVPSSVQCQKFCQNTEGCSHFLHFQDDNRCEAKYGFGGSKVEALENVFQGPRICPHDISQGGPYYFSLGVGQCLAYGGQPNFEIVSNGEFAHCEKLCTMHGHCIGFTVTSTDCILHGSDYNQMGSCVRNCTVLEFVNGDRESLCYAKRGTSEYQLVLDGHWNTGRDEMDITQIQNQLIALKEELEFWGRILNATLIELENKIGEIRGKTLEYEGQRWTKSSPSPFIKDDFGFLSPSRSLYDADGHWAHTADGLSQTVQDAPIGSVLYYNSTRDLQNYRVDLRCRLQGSGTAGLLVRVGSGWANSQLGPHVYIAVSTYAIHVAEFTDRYQVLETRAADISLQEWIDLIVEAENGEIRVKLNDITFAVETTLDSGGVGIRATGQVAIRHFYVSPLLDTFSPTLVPSHPPSTSPTTYCADELTCQGVNPQSSACSDIIFRLACPHRCGLCGTQVCVIEETFDEALSFSMRLQVQRYEVVQELRISSAHQAWFGVGFASGDDPDPKMNATHAQIFEVAFAPNFVVYDQILGHHEQGSLSSEQISQVDSSVMEDDMWVVTVTRKLGSNVNFDFSNIASTGVSILWAYGNSLFFRKHTEKGILSHASCDMVPEGLLYTDRYWKSTTTPPDSISPSISPLSSPPTRSSCDLQNYYVSRNGDIDFLGEIPSVIYDGIAFAAYPCEVEDLGLIEIDAGGFHFFGFLSPQEETQLLFVGRVLSEDASLTTHFTFDVASVDPAWEILFVHIYPLQDYIIDGPTAYPSIRDELSTATPSKFPIISSISTSTASTTTLPPTTSFSVHMSTTPSNSDDVDGVASPTQSPQTRCSSFDSLQTCRSNSCSWVEDTCSSNCNIVPGLGILQLSQALRNFPSNSTSCEIACMQLPTCYLFEIIGPNCLLFPSTPYTFLIGHTLGVCVTSGGIPSRAPSSGPSAVDTDAVKITDSESMDFLPLIIAANAVAICLICCCIFMCMCYSRRQRDKKLSSGVGGAPIPGAPMVPDVPNEWESQLPPSPPTPEFKKKVSSRLSIRKPISPQHLGIKNESKRSPTSKDNVFVPEKRLPEEVKSSRIPGRPKSSFQSHSALESSMEHSHETVQTQERTFDDHEANEESSAVSQSETNEENASSSQVRFLVKKESRSRKPGVNAPEPTLSPSTYPTPSATYSHHASFTSKRTSMYTDTRSRSPRVSSAFPPPRNSNATNPRGSTTMSGVPNSLRGSLPEELPQQMSTIQETGLLAERSNNEDPRFDDSYSREGSQTDLSIEGKDEIHGEDEMLIE